MITVYKFLLWAAEFELALAKKAPWRNHEHVAARGQDVDRWHKALTEARVNHG